MLKIATFNIKNDYTTYNSEKAEIITEFLKNNKIDIFCFQELFSKCFKDINKILAKSNYKFYGTYRYKLKLFDIINEKVDILTNKKVVKAKTYHLPFLPSTLKRIATTVEIDNKEFGNITIINTHLDHLSDLVKKRQLKKLLRIIKKEKNPIILTGDFNLKNNNAIFNNFVNELEHLGISRVAVNEKTLRQSKYKRAIDHIFISDYFIVRKVEVIKSLTISDHYPIIVKLEKRKFTKRN